MILAVRAWLNRLWAWRSPRRIWVEDDAPFGNRFPRVGTVGEAPRSGHFIEIRRWWTRY